MIDLTRGGVGVIGEGGELGVALVYTFHSPAPRFRAAALGHQREQFFYIRLVVAHRTADALRSDTARVVLREFGERLLDLGMDFIYRLRGRCGLPSYASLLILS